MARGKILGLNRDQAIHRAFKMVTALLEKKDGPKPIAYRLDGGFNGGFDPEAPHCASWSYGDRTPTSDCIGLVLWCSGVDRMQPGYKGTRGEWLNCASLMDDAEGAHVYCRRLMKNESARAGDWLLTRDHIGIIVRPDNDSADGFDHLVIDCSPRHGRSTAVNTGLPWSDACVVVRPTTQVYPLG